MVSQSPHPANTQHRPCPVHILLSIWLLQCDLNRTDLTDWYYRKLNKSPSTVEDPAYLNLPLCIPKVKKITLHFPLGLEVNARNMKGVTIKDALDAIHKQFKKRVRSPSLGIPVCMHLTSAYPHNPAPDPKMHIPAVSSIADCFHSKMTSSISPT